MAVLAAAVGCAESRPDRSPVVQSDPKDQHEPTGGSAAHAQLVEADLGAARPSHVVGNLYLAGLPAPVDFKQWKQAGIATVVSLLSEDEIDWDEAEAVRAAGMQFVSIPFGDDDEVFDRTREVLQQEAGKPLVLHCMSSNRVGSAWLTHRVLDQGVELERALNEAKQAGLRSSRLEERAVQYIERMRQSANSEPTSSDAAK